jgi:2-polyprenyl-6-methoxyphenol hydroxylase-like FAD-dependent oxidoreductase
MTNPGGGRLDVLIVGAGPTGLTLAGELQALGVSLRIVDRLPDRVHESRALVMQPRTLEVLRGLGATPELLRRGNDAVLLRLYGRSLATGWPPAAPGSSATSS